MTDDERTLLAFAEREYRHAGSRDRAIREELGLTPTEFYRRLGLLIDSAEALAASPMLVHRLRRMRDNRRPGGRGLVGRSARESA